MNSREKDIRFSGSTGFSISNFFPYRMNASDSSIPQLSIRLQNRRMLFFPLLRYRFVLVASSKTSRSPIERTIPTNNPCDQSSFVPLPNTLTLLLTIIAFQSSRFDGTKKMNIFIDIYILKSAPKLA